MKLFRDLICQVGKGHGCSLISAKVIDVAVVALAKAKPTFQNVQQNAPWGPQQGFLTRGHQEANRLLNLSTPEQWSRTDETRDPNYPAPNREKFFPNQTYASFSPQTENALNLTEQRAMAGSPVQSGMNAELLKTLNGNYLYGGDGFNAALQAANNKIIPMVQSTFNQGGRLNSGLAQQAQTQALADAFASQYGDERNRQMQSMLFAPKAAEADYQDLRRLAGVGEAREGQTQSGIDEARARYDFDMNLDAQKLAQYMGIVSGQLGSEGLSSLTGNQGNRGAGILGGALGGAKIGNEILPGGWGAAGGGLLGTLSGFF
jgi:hypothetical protein